MTASPGVISMPEAAAARRAAATRAFGLTNVVQRISNPMKATPCAENPSTSRENGTVLDHRFRTL